MLRLTLLLLGLAATCLGFRSVCYYTNWSQYRAGKGKYVPENLDPTLCTHLMYSFGKVDHADILAYEWNDLSTAWSTGMYDRMLAMKNKNPSMKVILAIGGWNMESRPFTAFAGTLQGRQKFIHNAIHFLRANNFDGLDMDWEYPGSRGSPPEDKQNFVYLIKELYQAFVSESYASGKPRLLLSGAFPAGLKTLEAGFDLPALHPYMDFISLMTYDFHGAWETVTGMNSPLYAHVNDEGEDRLLNMDWAVTYYVTHGVPKHKMNVGLATYGRTFTLKDPTDHGVGAPATGAGIAGRYTNEAGYLAYYEVCDMLKAGGKMYDVPSQRNRYVVLKDQWVGYEDTISIREKACYVKQHGFGGIMFWSLDTDDFSGQTCEAGPYPLMRSAIQEMQSPTFEYCVSPVIRTQETTAIPTQAPTPAPTPAPTQAPTTTKAPLVYGGDVTAAPTLAPIINDNTPAPQPPNYNQGIVMPALMVTADFDCSHLAMDFYPDPNSCVDYFICVGDLAMRSTCAPGLQFDRVHKQCDVATKVGCDSVAAAYRG